MDHKTIDKVIKKNEFLNAKVYYPGIDDKDWITLKNEVKKYSGKEPEEQTVKDLAEFLIDKPDYHDKNCDDLLGRVGKLGKCFKMEKFQEPDSIIEVCPDNNNESQFFIQGGNKRSIAYAMKIFKKELTYQPLTVDFYPVFCRYDRANRTGAETKKHEIQCD